MIYKYNYKTPDVFSNIVMHSDGDFLTGLWFEDSRGISKYEIDCKEKELQIFKETSKWLDIYFSGKEPDFIPRYKINGLTQFRKEVIDIMNTIPYGKTVTYNDISKTIAHNRGLKRMSSQAVGGAVGWNPICIIIPCHRVVGIDGNLTGYGGGIKNKVELLKLEKNDMNKFFISKRGTTYEKM